MARGIIGFDIDGEPKLIVILGLVRMIFCFSI